jgi:hypothetical protein
LAYISTASNQDLNGNLEDVKAPHITVGAGGVATRANVVRLLQRYSRQNFVLFFKKRTMYQ